LVNLVENWEDIEKYTRHLEHWAKIGSYQLRKSDEGAEIKVCVGKFGYSKKFKESQDPELIKILAFCQAEGFIKVLGSISNDLFYA
jgi:hypothetical protein